MHTTAPLSNKLSIQSLRPLVDAALARSRAFLPSEVALLCSLSDAPLGVRANRTQLENVLVSLCTLAWLALGAGGGCVLVTMDEVVLDEVVLDDEAAPLLGGIPPRRHVSLRVSSSTKGFDGAVQVLNPESPHISRPQSGEIRLPMTVVRNIIEAHRGSLIIQNTVDEETAFEIYLPEVAVPDAITTSVDQSIDTRPAQIARVLYVDDYESMRLMMSEILQDAGCKVSCYGHPQAALAVLRADPHEFDLVVTDQNMPGMSGLDFAKILKNIRPDLPIAIISGSVDDSLEYRALEAGVSLVLKKSDAIDVLCKELLRIIVHR